MRSFALLLFLMGIITIIIGALKTRQQCPPPRIEYRFVPRSLLDEQLDSQSLKNLDNLFDNQDPWLGIDVVKHKLDSDGNMNFANDDKGLGSREYDKGQNFYTTQKTT
jgi:hypothetical protein